MDHELTHDEISAAFADFGVLTFSDDVIPASITNPVARRTLSVLGIPRTLTDAVILNPVKGRPDGFRTMADIYQGPHRPDFDHLFYLGMFGRFFATFDGASGSVFALEEDIRSTPLAENLYQFSVFLFLIQNEIDSISPSTTDADLVELEDQLIARFLSIESSSATVDEELWRETIRDIFAELD